MSRIRERARALLRRRRERHVAEVIELPEPPAPPTPVTFAVFEPSSTGPQDTGERYDAEYGEDGRFRFTHRHEEPT